MTRRGGFTLIEIVIVLLIIGVMASVALPRLSFYFEPPSVLLQRSVEEAGSLALSGVAVRFVWRPAPGSLLGEIAVEALMKQETEQSELDAFLGRESSTEALAWKPVRIAYPPAGSSWRMEPNIVYFYTDGSCTPARLSWGPAEESEEFLLTVTGYCVEAPRQYSY